MTEKLCNISMTNPDTDKMAEWINVYLYSGRFKFNSPSQVKPIQSYPNWRSELNWQCEELCLKC